MPIPTQFGPKHLQNHIKNDHHYNKLSSYLKEIVYGGSDGIVTTFAVVAGFAGAQSDPTNPLVPMSAVLLFGFANLVADGASMGLGNFLSLRSEQDLYHHQKKTEAREINDQTEYELAETEYLLKHKGFSPNEAASIAKTFATNKLFWLEFMMNYELEIPNYAQEKPAYRALVTFISFISFGLIPLLPYIIYPHGTYLFALAILSTLIALSTLGYFRARISSSKLIHGIIEVLIIGSVAATLAYIVGLLFRI